MTTKYVYISSLPRSGSTLLSMLLGSHEKIFSPGEFVLFGQALQSNSTCTCGKPIRECDFWGFIIEKLTQQGFTGKQENGGNFVTLVYPFEFMKSRLQKSLIKLYYYALLHHSRFLIDIATANRKGYPYHMKKAVTNSTILLENLYQYFPDPDTIILDASKTVTTLNHLYIKQPFPVKVIALIRDGRGSVNSWLKSDQTSFIDTVKSWQFHMETQQKSLKGIKAGDKIFVRYEDLCRNPEGELKRLCDFLEIPYQGKMLAMEGPFHMLGGNPGTYASTKTIRLDNGWACSFDKEQLTLFDELAGSLNKELGY
ncbi:MAG: sulfotransferase [bacterium]